MTDKITLITENPEGYTQKPVLVTTDPTGLTQKPLLVKNVDEPTIELQEKRVSPLTTELEVEADEGYDGLSKVTVNAVTSAIDSNIQAGNIKKDVTILGITGNFQGGKEEQAKTEALSMLSGDQVITPDTNKTLSQVTITKPATLIPENIKKDIVIGGVTGNLESGITPTGNINITSTSQVDVTNYATAQVVDANLVAGNIKNGTSILGVSGSYTGLKRRYIGAMIAFSSSEHTGIEFAIGNFSNLDFYDEDGVQVLPQNVSVIITDSMNISTPVAVLNTNNTSVNLTDKDFLSRSCGVALCNLSTGKAVTAYSSYMMGPTFIRIIFSTPIGVASIMPLAYDFNIPNEGIEVMFYIVNDTTYNEFCINISMSD